MIRISFGVKGCSSINSFYAARNYARTARYSRFRATHQPYRGDHPSGGPLVPTRGGRPSRDRRHIRFSASCTPGAQLCPRAGPAPKRSPSSAGIGRIVPEMVRVIDETHLPGGHSQSSRPLKAAIVPRSEAPARAFSRVFRRRVIARITAPIRLPRHRLWRHRGQAGRANPTVQPRGGACLCAAAAPSQPVGRSADPSTARSGWKAAPLVRPRA